MNANWLKGTGVALVTPFKQDLSVDFDKLEKLVDYVISNGVNYLVALGTTAETPTLSKDEKKDILHCILERNNQRVPVVCGIGGNNTNSIVSDFNYYPLDRVDAILSVTPYYNKPNQRGLLEHYKTLNLSTPKPIILYNVPGRTGVNMLPSTSLTLARECQHVIAIKEACGNINQCMDLVQNKPENFLILSGDDDLALAQMAIGFDGIISVAANCFPKDFSLMISEALNNQMVNARALHYKLLQGIQLLFVEGNPAGVKAVLSEMGLCENVLRSPLLSVSEETLHAIKKYLQR